MEWAHTIKAVAFDMDGLMVNTEAIYTQVGDIVLQRRGKRFTAELKKKMMGLQPHAAFKTMIDHEGLSDSIEVLADESCEVFNELLPKQLQAMPGLMELLGFLDQAQIPRCVATSSARQFADQVLSLVGVTEQFEFVMTAEDVANGKPEPDIYIAAATRLNVAPHELLVLEDSQHGSTAGVRSGACTVAVPSEESQDHDFSIVHFIADSLADERIRNLLG